MAHQRKLIRQAAVATLLAANTAAGARVQGTRTEPHKRTQLPAISVYTLSESTDLDISAQSAPRELTRNLKLEVTGWVAHSDDNPADDRMDDLAEQIEAALEADRWISGLTPPANSGTVADSILEGVTMAIVEGDGLSDPMIGIVTLTYAVTYRTTPADFGTAADFTDADAKYQLVGGVTDTVKAEDDFNPQETP